MNFAKKQFLKAVDTIKSTRSKKTPKLERYNESGLYEYVMYLSSPFRIFFYNLLAGIARGFGFVLGATVVVALTVYIVSKILVQMPIVGQYFESLDKLLQENLEKTPINYNL